MSLIVEHFSKIDFRLLKRSTPFSSCFSQSSGKIDIIAFNLLTNAVFNFILILDCSESFYPELTLKIP